MVHVEHREARGLAFVEFSDPKDAEEAKYSLDRSTIGGREVSHVYMPHTVLPSHLSPLVANTHR